MAGLVEEMPNIGPVLGKRLRAVGFDTLEDLLRTGDDEAYTRLKVMFPHEACYSTRLALAGAVRGIRHRDLDAALKIRLKDSL